ncbi:hypothetical protein niasHS_017578 [Heterodera schachtii]|uniref:Uncharacterized protein n=2 Tax=Heterodera TaxID=34509 RepID=A0ABD2HW45_HETSC
MASSLRLSVVRFCLFVVCALSLYFSLCLFAVPFIPAGDPFRRFFPAQSLALCSPLFLFWTISLIAIIHIKLSNVRINE